MKLTTTIQNLKDKSNILATKYITHNRFFLLCSLEIAYLAWQNPALFIIGTAIAGLSVLLILIVSSFFSITSQSKLKYASLLAVTCLFLSLSAPSYAFLDGFETVLTTVIESTGGAVDSTVATLMVNLLKVGFFAVIVITAISLFFARQDEEKVKGILLTAGTILGIYVLIEIAGNFIFGSGGGSGGGVL